MIMETSSNDDKLSQDPVEIERLSQPPGYCMCWDNVGKKVVTRHPTENLKTRFMNMTLGYMAVNRVKSTGIARNTEDVINAKDLTIDTFVSSQKDIDQLRSRMTVIVGRITTRHIKWFHDHCEDISNTHIAMSTHYSQHGEVFSLI